MKVVDLYVCFRVCDWGDILFFSGRGGNLSTIKQIHYYYYYYYYYYNYYYYYYYHYYHYNYYYYYQ